MSSIDRRRFLRDTGLTMAGVVAAGNAVTNTGLAAPATTTPTDEWAAIRSQFDLSRDWVHLAGFFLVSHPKPVREAIERFRKQLDANPFEVVERGCFGKPEENMDLRVKRAAAAYLGGSPDEIALTQSTTMGLALTYLGLPLRAGQEVLTTAHDHYAHHEAIRLAALRSGASTRRIALFDSLAELPAITVDSIVSRIKQAIRPETRVVALTWVHSQTGLKLPLRAIAAAIREANAGRTDADRVLMIVDGVHGIGCEDETIAETGCDIFVAGTHKWLFGPRGTGLIWANQRAWAAMRPSIPTFDEESLYVAWIADAAPKAPAKASWFTPGGFHAFEHEWAVESAFEFHRSIGRAKIAARIHSLNTRIKQGLSEFKHVKLYTPMSEELSAGLVGFDVDGLEPAEVVQRLLQKKIIASESPYARTVARLSAGLMNTPEDVDVALRAVGALKI